MPRRATAGSAKKAPPTPVATPSRYNLRRRTAQTQPRPQRKAASPASPPTQQAAEESSQTPSARTRGRTGSQQRSAQKKNKKTPSSSYEGSASREHSENEQERHGSEEGERASPSTPITRDSAQRANQPSTESQELSSIPEGGIASMVGVAPRTPSVRQFFSRSFTRRTSDIARGSSSDSGEKTNEEDTDSGSSGEEEEIARTPGGVRILTSGSKKKSPSFQVTPPRSSARRSLNASFEEEGFTFRNTSDVAADGVEGSEGSSAKTKHPSYMTASSGQTGMMSSSLISKDASTAYYNELKLVVSRLQDHAAKHESRLSKLVDGSQDVFSKVEEMQKQIGMLHSRDLEQSEFEETQTSMLLDLEKELRALVSTVEEVQKEGGRSFDGEKEKLEQISKLVETQHSTLEVLRNRIQKLEEDLNREDEAYLYGDRRSTDEIEELIERALSRYSADRLGRADFASKGAGAVVVHAESELALQPGESHGLLSKLAFLPDLLLGSLSTSSPQGLLTSPAYSATNGGTVGWLVGQVRDRVVGGEAELAISPNVDLGNCWSFAGSQGRITVKFATSLIPQAVSVDHVDQQVAVDISSAPKKFYLWGLFHDEIGEIQRAFLGNFTYQVPGPSLQTFNLPEDFKESEMAFRAVTAEIVSNHGNPDYTCLYRLRVHGRPLV